MMKTYKQLMIILNSGKILHPKEIFRIPIKKIYRNEPTGYNKKAKKYAKWMKKGMAKTVPAVNVGHLKGMNSSAVHKKARPGSFYIWDGHHRLAAHKHIKRKTIKAKIV